MMSNAAQSTNQGGGASRSSLEHSATTGPSNGAQTSQLDGYLDSPHYDEDDGFVTAGAETDRVSQASGHGGRKNDNDKCNPTYLSPVGRKERPRHSIAFGLSPTSEK